MSTLAQRIMEEGCDFDMMVKGCVCPDSAGPDDGPCDYCVIKAKVQTILAAALADAARVARVDEREACAQVCDQHAANQAGHCALVAAEQSRQDARAIRTRVGEGDATHE